MAGRLPPRPEGRKAEGPRGRPTWVVPELTPETTENLMRRFPQVVRLPEEDIRSRTEEWLAQGVIAKSLGRRVPVEAAVRELRLRGGLKGEVAGYPMEDGYMTFRFAETEDRDRILQRPWTVNGQLLAVERWKPRFKPSRFAIQSAVVWIRLPWLPVEFWGEETVRRVLEPAGELVCLDECTVHHRRLGFARAAVRISLAHPLRPGVVIGEPEGDRWQRFVYEQIAGICFSCGTFHGNEVACPEVEGGGPVNLQAENFVEDPCEEGEGSGVRRELGPWITAVRRWLLAEQRGKPPGKMEKSGSEHPVTTRQSEVAAGKKPLIFGEVPVGSQAAEGWSKPSKVARRRSPPPAPGPEVRHEASLNPFAALSVGGERTEARGNPAHLKWTRSPIRQSGPLRGEKMGQPTVRTSKGKNKLLG